MISYKQARKIAEDLVARFHPTTRDYPKESDLRALVTRHYPELTDWPDTGSVAHHIVQLLGWVVIYDMTLQEIDAEAALVARRVNEELSLFGDDTDWSALEAWVVEKYGRRVSPGDLKAICNQAAKFLRLPKVH